MATSVQSRNRDPHKNVDSFFRRALPETCIAFNSKLGRQLFLEALHDKYMEAYFLLSIQFLTQSEPAFCGIASLCMVLNALEIDPVRQWKGVWRWWDESMLDCCRPLEQVKERGITLPELACVARCNGLDVQLKLAQNISCNEFENDIRYATSTPGVILVVSYSRAALGQTGNGHFSPAGGFHASSKQVLVMDVARFKYPPSWVSLDMLWEALLPKDVETGKSRGYLILQRGSNGSTPCFTTQALSSLSLNKSQWPKLFQNLYVSLPSSFHLSPTHSLDNVFERFINAVPDEYIECVKDRRILFTAPAIRSSDVQLPSDTESVPSDSGLNIYLCELNNLLFQISQLRLYTLVANSMAAHRKLLLRQASSILSAALVQTPQLSASVTDSARTDARRSDDAPASLFLCQLSRAQQHEYGKIISQIQAMYPSNDANSGDLSNGACGLDNYCSEVFPREREASASSLSSMLSLSLVNKLVPLTSAPSPVPCDGVFPEEPVGLEECLPQSTTAGSAKLLRQLSISSSSAAPSLRSNVCLRSRVGLRELSVKNLQCLTNPLYDSWSTKGGASNEGAGSSLNPAGSSPSLSNTGPNDFLCFLTLFILAVFSFKEPFDNIDESLTLQLKELTNIEALAPAIVKEVQLLRNQIAVLDDTCSDSRG